MSHPEILQKFIHYYESFDVSNKELFVSLYSQDIIFSDPFKTLKGREKVYEYFLQQMERVTTCNFIIGDIMQDKDMAAVVWKMQFSHPMMAKGRLIDVHGMSHLKFDSKIIYHKDFFDSSELIYRQIPVVGRVIQWIEGRL